MRETARRGRRTAGAALSIVVLLIASGGVTARPAEPPVPATNALDQGPDAGPLVPPGPAPDLVLLYTGGVIGYVEPCG